MVDVTARCATKSGLRDAGFSVDAPAVRARLRRVGCGDFYQFSACPLEFIPQEFDETAPSGLVDASGESSICFDHTSNVQFLDDHTALAISDVTREFVQKIVPLSSYYAMQAGNTELGLFPVLRSFPPSRDDTLSVSKANSRAFHPLRIFDEIPVAICDEVDDATVKGNGGQGTRKRIGNLKNADDRGEPLIAVSGQRAGLWRSFKWAVSDDSKWATEFREVQPVRAESPYLRMRFAEVDNVASFTLPPGLHGEFLETTLPSKVEFNKDLRTDIARNVSKPRKFGSQFSQLVDLIEGGEILAVALGMGKPNQALLIRQVPEEAQGIAPSVESSYLLSRRIDSKPECLADLQVRFFRAASRILRISSETERPSAFACSCSQTSSGSERVIMRFLPMSKVYPSARCLSTHKRGRAFLHQLKQVVSSPEI